MKTTPIPPPPLPPGSPNLVVTGFMGTGKSTVGRLVAKRLAMPFFDLDDVVQRRAGMPIPEIFDRHGEARFRDLERQAIVDASQLSGAVIATGGGAPLHREFELLRATGTVVVLACAADELAARLEGNGTRPLLRDRPSVALHAERATAYAAAGIAIDTTALSPEGVTDAVIARFESSPGRTVAVETREDRYDVVIGHARIGSIGERVVAAAPLAVTAAVAFDPAVEPVAAEVARYLRRAGLRVAPVALPTGEAAKSVHETARLWSELLAAGVEASDVVVAVGGGAAIDAAGFAAATYMRGVATVNVPTTLLAMVDASVGGKVAVDHGGIKNLVGGFHHPRLVVCDVETLASLPERERAGGMAEIVKAGVLASPLFLETLEDGIDDLEWVVEQAIRIKAAYVAADPRDTGTRHALNLGHTFAHALESATDHALLHGEAVAIGLVAAANLGTALGVTPTDLPLRLRSLLDRIGLPTAPPSGVSPDGVAAAMLGDKKRRSGDAVFVVPTDAGCALIEAVDASAALEALFEPQRVAS